MPRTVCPGCRLEMRPKSQPVAAEAMMITGPYQLYAADLYACPKCGKEVLTGFGQAPIAERFHPRYADIVGSWAEDGHYQYWANAEEKRQFEESFQVKRR